MLYPLKKSSFILVLFLVLIIACKAEQDNGCTTIEVQINNWQSLDSLIIYDKEKGWQIESVLRFQKSATAIDTLKIEKSKLYQIYSFNDGVQGQFGEVLLSPVGKVVLSLDESKPFETAKYDGNFKTSNNFLAYSKNYQHQLSEMVRAGIQQETLDILIEEKRDLIHRKGISLNIVDSLKNYVKEDFQKFSDILKIKNKKYLYKTSLVNQIGNQFAFKDVNNKVKRLKDYEGKYVYIDVWATWCKPCKLEYPFLKKLEEHFGAKNEVQIISISTDRKFERWKNHLLDNKFEGVQLYSGDNSEFVKFYDIGALPRFIMLDKEGKIVNPDEIRPSNPELLPKLNSMVNNTI